MGTSTGIDVCLGKVCHRYLRLHMCEKGGQERGRKGQRERECQDGGRQQAKRGGGNGRSADWEQEVRGG